MADYLVSLNQPATWTAAELAAFSKKELNYLAYGLQGFETTTAVKQFVLLKPLSPANQLLAREVKRGAAAQAIINPARIETQIREGNVDFGTKEIKVTMVTGEVKTAPASAVPTFNAVPKTGIDPLVVAITTVVRIDQGAIVQIISNEGWSTAFSGDKAVMNPTGLKTFFDVVSSVIRKDSVYVNTISTLGKTVGGYQFVNFCHGMLMRASQRDYLAMAWSLSCQLMSVFTSKKAMVEVDGLQVHEKIWTTYREKKTDGTFEVKRKGDKQAFVMLPMKGSVRSFAAEIKSEIPMFMGGLSLGMTSNKFDGKIDSVIKSCTAMMQFRGGLEGGLGTFTSSMGFGNLLAPATRRQILLVSLARSVQAVKQTPAIHCKAGDFIAVIFSMDKPFKVVMTYEEQKKISIPKGMDIDIVDVGEKDDVQVWWDDTDVPNTEAKRIEKAHLNLKEWKGWPKIAIWAPVFMKEQLPTGMNYYPLPGRGSPDFQAIVTNVITKLVGSPGTTDVQLVSAATTMDGWYTYVQQSSAAACQFLVRPRYILTNITNILRKPKPDVTSSIIITEDGEWEYSVPDAINLGDDEESSDDDDSSSDDDTVEITVPMSAIGSIIPKADERPLKKKRPLKVIWKSLASKEDGWTDRQQFMIVATKEGWDEEVIAEYIDNKNAELEARETDLGMATIEEINL